MITSNDIPDIALFFMEKHGLLTQGWTFAWDRARRRAGCCHYTEKQITLSYPYVRLNVQNQLDDVIDTILHEIAHALTPGHHHDFVWRAKCREIGARPRRCYEAGSVDMPRGNYVARCGGCGKEFHRYKRPAPRYIRWCGDCGQERGRLVYSPVQADLYGGVRS